VRIYRQTLVNPENTRPMSPSLRRHCQWTMCAWSMPLEFQLAELSLSESNLDRTIKKSNTPQRHTQNRGERCKGRQVCEHSNPTGRTTSSFSPSPGPSSNSWQVFDYGRHETWLLELQPCANGSRFLASIVKPEASVED
jgi:hypothetical protein